MSQQADGARRLRSPADTNRCMTEGRTTQSSAQDQATYDDQNDTPSHTERQTTLTKVFARRHHVHTTVANQSGEFALRNHRAKLRGERMSLNGFS